MPVDQIWLDLISASMLPWLKATTSSAVFIVLVIPSFICSCEASTVEVALLMLSFIAATVWSKLLADAALVCSTASVVAALTSFKLLCVAVVKSAIVWLPTFCFTLAIAISSCWPWHNSAQDPASRSALSQCMTVCVAVQQSMFSSLSRPIQPVLCIAQ
jgi:hypothetical protein